jgi:hypothetical protein
MMRQLFWNNRIEYVGLNTTFFWSLDAKDKIACGNASIETYEQMIGL